jgi:hypothetical protein
MTSVEARTLERGGDGQDSRLAAVIGSCGHERARFFVPGTLAFWGAVDTSTVDTSTQVDISCPVFG